LRWPKFQRADPLHGSLPPSYFFFSCAAVVCFFPFCEFHPCVKSVTTFVHPLFYLGKGSADGSFPRSPHHRSLSEGRESFGALAAGPAHGLPVLSDIHPPLCKESSPFLARVLVFFLTVRVRCCLPSPDWSPFCLFLLQSSLAPCLFPLTCLRYRYQSDGIEVGLNLRPWLWFFCFCPASNLRYPSDLQLPSCISHCQSHWPPSAFLFFFSHGKSLVGVYLLLPFGFFRVFLYQSFVGLFFLQLLRTTPFMVPP